MNLKHNQLLMCIHHTIKTVLDKFALMKYDDPAEMNVAVFSTTMEYPTYTIHIANTQYNHSVFIFTCVMVVLGTTQVCLEVQLQNT